MSSLFPGTPPQPSASQAPTGTKTEAETVNQPATLPATLPARGRLVVQDEGPLAFLFDTARFEHMMKIARVMANDSFTPKHLVGDTPDQTLATCFRVCNQAVRWGFDPFAVADETYAVHNKLGYQGKLVAAVVNARAGLKGRLRPTYSGPTGNGKIAPDERTVTISGTFENETEPREITISLMQVKTDNKMWITDPDQKLFYTGAVRWARRHCPEVLLGVVTDDDLERIGAQRFEDVPPDRGRVDMSARPDRFPVGNGHPTPIPTPEATGAAAPSSAPAPPEVLDNERSGIAHPDEPPRVPDNGAIDEMQAVAGATPATTTITPGKSDMGPDPLDKPTAPKARGKASERIR